MKSQNNFILYDREFTPSKDYIQVYITSSGNNYPEPIEFYVDNIKITDGTTEDVIDGGIGNKVAFKYRMLDAPIGRLLSIDKLASKYPGVTPYAFVRNNPVWRREFLGLTDFKVNKKGKVRKVEGTETESGPDRLIAGRKVKYNKDGELKNNKFIEVEKGILQNRNEVKYPDGNGNTEENTFFKTKTNDESLNLFKFFSENTDVEFSKTDFVDGSDKFSYISTSHKVGEETSASRIISRFANDQMRNVTPVLHIHDHKSARIDAQGIHHHAVSTPSDADKLFRSEVRKRYPEMKFSIFMPTRGTFNPPLND